MNVTGSSQSCKKIDAQALAIAVFKDDKADQGLLKELDAAFQNALDFGPRQSCASFVFR